MGQPQSLVDEGLIHEHAIETAIFEYLHALRSRNSAPVQFPLAAQAAR